MRYTSTRVLVYLTLYDYNKIKNVICYKIIIINQLGINGMLNYLDVLIIYQISINKYRIHTNIA